MRWWGNKSFFDSAWHRMYPLGLVCWLLLLYLAVLIIFGVEYWVIYGTLS